MESNTTHFVFLTNTEKVHIDLVEVICKFMMNRRTQELYQISHKRLIMSKIHIWHEIFIPTMNAICYVIFSRSFIKFQVSKRIGR
jgi:hypothetical protein